MSYIYFATHEILCWNFKENKGKKNPSEWALKSARLTVQRGQYIAPLRITRRIILWWGL